ncbi:MAG: hypothetical protein IIC69_01360 [Nanoarchaeota archaeon]|nr:hypothetical protein [Nanoarchaeota archaeon]
MDKQKLEELVENLAQGELNISVQEMRDTARLIRPDKTPATDISIVNGLRKLFPDVNEDKLVSFTYKSDEYFQAVSQSNGAWDALESDSTEYATIVRQLESDLDKIITIAARLDKEMVTRKWRALDPSTEDIRAAALGFDGDRDGEAASRYLNQFKSLLDDNFEVLSDNNVGLLKELFRLASIHPDMLGGYIEDHRKIIRSDAKGKVASPLHYMALGSTLIGKLRELAYSQEQQPLQLILDKGIRIVDLGKDIDDGILTVIVSLDYVETNKVDSLLELFDKHREYIEFAATEPPGAVPDYNEFFFNHAEKRMTTSAGEVSLFEAVRTVWNGPSKDAVEFLVKYADIAAEDDISAKMVDYTLRDLPVNTYGIELYFIAVKEGLENGKRVLKELLFRDYNPRDIEKALVDFEKLKESDLATVNGSPRDLRSLVEAQMITEHTLPRWLDSMYKSIPDQQELLEQFYEVGKKSGKEAKVKEVWQRYSGLTLTVAGDVTSVDELTASRLLGDKFERYIGWRLNNHNEHLSVFTTTELK